MTKGLRFNIIFFVFTILSSLTLAQTRDAKSVIWEEKRIDLGTILVESGIRYAEFKFTQNQDSLLIINDVLTDCGCTTVDFTKDSISQGSQGFVKVEFDPISAVGDFERMVIVKGNLQSMEDTLFIEGQAIPIPGNPLIDYPYKKLDLGFRQEKIRVGDVFTNKKKFKAFEIFNFSSQPILADSVFLTGSDFIEFSKISDSIPAQGRGLIGLVYDGKKRNDLGFFEDRVYLGWSNSDSVPINIIADVFEYFPPVSKNNFRQVPQMSISQKEIDWGDIDEGSIKEEEIIISNRGLEVLNIRKLQGNCSCMTQVLKEDYIDPGKSTSLKIRFDSKGRFGRDQRNIYLFSNDPLNPVQVIVLKSRIE